MNTPCIQELEDTSLESITNDRNNNEPSSSPRSPRSPLPQSDLVSNLTPRRVSHVSSEDVVVGGGDGGGGGGISANDILNHDYNQMRIDEGRMHRMNQKKSESMRDDSSDIFVTQVTLNLDIVENRPHSGSTWKYNAIKKNNSFANPVKLNNINCNRPK